MTRLLRFSPSRLAVGYVILSVIVLGLFAVPLWYMWGKNLSTFRAYVDAKEVEQITRTFERDGADATVAAINARVDHAPAGEIVVLADPAKRRIAGTLASWPPGVPDSAGTYGLIVDADGTSMRIVASHLLLPGGYHLLVGRESARFQSLVDYFWFGIAGAVALALALGALVGWLVRRALLFEVQRISRMAAAIVEGDLSRRLPEGHGSSELDDLAGMVNSMLEQLARQNEALAGEIAIRKEAEKSLQQAHHDLEQLVTQRTLELAEANDSLRRSEARFALAVDAAGDGFVDWVVATDTFYASPRLLEFCGLPASTKFAGRADYLARFPYHPDDRERVIAAINGHFARGTLRLEEEMRILRHGAVRCLHLTGLCSRDSTGALVRWTAAITDVTDRRAAEEALRLSERRYALAMEATGDGHWDWDIPADKFYASPLLLEMIGIDPGNAFSSRQEWLRRFPFHPDDRRGYEQALAAHFEGRTARLDMEMRILPRGELRWIHLTGLCLRDERGKPIRWAGSVTDVTARKRVEDELRARQDMLDLAQEAARAVAFEWRIGAGEGENRWSPDLEAMYGLSPGAYDGTYESWKKRIYPEDWPSVRAAIASAQKTGDVDAEYRVLHRGGALRRLQAKGRMFFDRDGTPTRIVGFMLDVTDRHVAEAELRRMEDQLRRAQRLEAMGTLAGGIAHDFNNLLGAILGYGEMALRDAPEGTRLRRDLDNVMIAGERGRALVDRILAFSRSGVGERVAVDVEAVARETLRLLAPKLPAGISLEERLDAGRPAVMGDATQIHQVLMNLMTNAVQAMPAGGVLRVALQRIDVTTPRIATTGTLVAAPHVALEVQDTGSGMASDVAERIFDPFFTTKEVGVGTGLGLSLVHGIVTGLGGAVDVTSDVGRGSTFTVYLPCAGAVSDAEADASVPDATRRGERQQILVIDDEPALVTLTVERLAELGYAPAGFTSSGAALAAFMADPDRFKAVVTDESMPGMSGAELIRKVRAARAHLPILLVSGYLSADVIRRARDAGANEVLKKPLSAADLAEALARVLEARARPPDRSAA